jgi:hypothetical protein
MQGRIIGEGILSWRCSLERDNTGSVNRREENRVGITEKAIVEEIKMTELIFIIPSIPVS